MSKTTQTGLTADQRLQILSLAKDAADSAYFAEIEATKSTTSSNALYVAPKDNRLSLTIRIARKFAAFVENAPKDESEVENEKDSPKKTA